jgi:hypothetical protein
VIRFLKLCYWSTSEEVGEARMQLEKIIGLMRRVSLFNSISARDFEHLAPYIKTAEFNKDMTVASMGE